MTVKDMCKILDRFTYFAYVAEPDALVRVHIGNQLYDVKDIDTVIDMDANKPNIVIHVDDK